MKTFLLSLLMLVSASSFAHHVQQSCVSGGKVKMIGTDFRDGGKNYVKVTLQNALWGNGVADTLVKLDGEYSFCIYVPSGAGAVIFKNTNHTGAVNGEVYSVQTISCNALPLKFGQVKVVKTGGGMAKVTIPVYDVVNVHRIEIRVSVDGKNYVVRGIVFPEEGKEQQNYSVTIKL